MRKTIWLVFMGCLWFLGCESVEVGSSSDNNYLPLDLKQQWLTDNWTEQDRYDEDTYEFKGVGSIEVIGLYEVEDEMWKVVEVTHVPSKDPADEILKKIIGRVLMRSDEKGLEIFGYIPTELSEGSVPDFHTASSGPIQYLWEKAVPGNSQIFEFETSGPLGDVELKVTFSIEEKGDLATSSGSYKNVILLSVNSQVIGSGHEPDVVKVWLAPGIGPIKAVSTNKHSIVGGDIVHN